MNKKEYLLLCLMEECTELAQTISKMIRFGEHDCHPDTRISNYDEFYKEANDVMALVDLLNRYHDLNLFPDLKLIRDKQKRLQIYIDYSTHIGVIDEKVNERKGIFNWSNFAGNQTK